MIFGGGVDRTQFAPQVAGATSFDRARALVMRGAVRNRVGPRLVMRVLRLSKKGNSYVSSL